MEGNSIERNLGLLLHRFIIQHFFVWLLSVGSSHASRPDEGVLQALSNYLFLHGVCYLNVLVLMMVGGRENMKVIKEQYAAVLIISERKKKRS